MKLFLAAAVCASLLGLSWPALALTVRVESPGGAPRLVVDGKPMRSRIFWGAPGSSPIAVTPQAREMSFDFVAAGNANNGTMHFRFGNQAGEVRLDDIRVVDLETNQEILPRCDFEKENSFAREWSVWPPAEKNTVGKVELAPGTGQNGSAALKINIAPPADGNWPDFHIYHHANLPLVEGRRYRASFWAHATPERKITVAFYRPGASYVHLGGPAGSFEKQIKLAADVGVNFVSFPCALPWPEPGKETDWSAPDAQCATVLRANPNALLIPRIGMDPPAWWCKANPDDVMQWEDGSRANYAVPASPRYRREAAARLAALIEHLEAKFGERIAGYHPGGQNTAEWFYEGTWKKPLSGYAPADLAAWRAWLKNRYANDAALQTAWHKAASLETVAVPTPAERHAAPGGFLRDPTREQHLIDWAAFQQEAMADCVLSLARAARTASGGRKLVLFFYGYVFEFGPIGNGPAVSGHYALRRVLNSPDIDVLCSPISYFDRGLGGSAPSMTAAESVALAGKLWLSEDDTHTYLATGDPPGSKDHVDTLEASNAQLTRNVAQAALRNFATWWMDLTATGWFNDAGMWAEMKRLNALDEPLLQNPTKFAPEVAVVIDEKAMLRVAAGGNSVTGPGIYEARRALGRMGAPYGQYLLDDVLAGRVKAKLYVFMNGWDLTEDERKKLPRNAVNLWCNDLTARKPKDAPFTEIQSAAGREIYPTTNALSSDTLRYAARHAGVHLFTQSDCNVYASGNYLALHAAQDGPLQINTGKTAPVFDVLTNQKIADGPQFSLPIKRGETRVLRIGN